MVSLSGAMASALVHQFIQPPTFPRMCDIETRLSRHVHGVTGVSTYLVKGVGNSRAIKLQTLIRDREA